MKITFELDSDGDAFSNINVARALIEDMTEYPSLVYHTPTRRSTFDIEDLEEIANHLLAYCECERKRS